MLKNQLYQGAVTILVACSFYLKNDYIQGTLVCELMESGKWETCYRCIELAGLSLVYIQICILYNGVLNRMD